MHANVMKPKERAKDGASIMVLMRLPSAADVAALDALVAKGKHANRSAWLRHVVGSNYEPGKRGPKAHKPKAAKTKARKPAARGSKAPKAKAKMA